jgi:hypothetical protein
MMELVYRTLQRPQVDVLAVDAEPTSSNKGDGACCTSAEQDRHKLIDIGSHGELGEMVRRPSARCRSCTSRSSTALDGEAYTYDGHVRDAEARAGEGAKVPADMPSFGFRDLKGKGATDMWLAGEPIERIQLLCGHASKTTTEIYIKARWRETAAPNSLVIGR